MVCGRVCRGGGGVCVGWRSTDRKISGVDTVEFTFMRRGVEKTTKVSGLFYNF